MRTKSSIAIDGPVASGKTVVGRLLAKRLGYRFLDTGAMYRAVTLAALKSRVSLEDEIALAKLAQRVCIEVTNTPHGEQVRLDGKDVTTSLRSANVEQAVSLVARIPGVREAMVARQQAMAEGGNIVMVGRDIGTKVLPNAAVKVFLQASVAERARRRYQELLAFGQKPDYTAVQQELEERDRLDTQRAHSPLRAAPDAHLVNTEGVPVDEVVQRILALVKE